MTEKNRLIQSKTKQRRSGILAHISSLPSPYGIGDMGPGTYDFLNFLRDSGQSIWQILPLGPTEAAFSNSPYMTVSAFAGNPLLISPAKLYEDGLLTKKEFISLPNFPPYYVDYAKAIELKRDLLKTAYLQFLKKKDPLFDSFVKETWWLEDYCLFKAIKEKYSGKSWITWDLELRERNPERIKKAKESLAENFHYYNFEQYIFSRQWQLLREFAHDCGIEIFGDIPIYISFDSADVWSHQNIFELDSKTGEPLQVAGVPPDYFSDTGQKWGNPLYRWNTNDPEITAALFKWWTFRFQHVFEQVDLARIDHFRGFESFWAVHAHEETALNGTWRKGPGKEFFSAIFAELGPLRIVAEDLGEITEDVITLRNELGFPGMKVLQFAFDDNPKNDFLPHNFISTNCVVYTGTHDNDTSVGWFLSDKLNDEIRRRIKQTANRDLHDQHGIHKDLIYLAMSSIANTSIYPLQDIFGFGNDCRMNTPGTEQGNWLWRCSDEFLTPEVSKWLRDQTEKFGRTPADKINTKKVP